MKKVILYIAQSLDGYVATKDGGVAWLDDFNSGESDYGYAEFNESIDTVVQGETTYEQFHDKHPGKQSYVFSEKADSLSEEGITFVKGSPKEFIEGLDEATHKNIWLVGGPNLLAGFLNEGQVHEMIIFIMPVLLKEGIPLFSNLELTPRVSFEEVKNYSNGVLELRYSVKG